MSLYIPSYLPMQIWFFHVRVEGRCSRRKIISFWEIVTTGGMPSRVSGPLGTMDYSGENTMGRAACAQSQTGFAGWVDVKVKYVTEVSFDLTFNGTLWNLCGTSGLE